MTLVYGCALTIWTGYGLATSWKFRFYYSPGKGIGDEQAPFGNLTLGEIFDTIGTTQHPACHRSLLKYILGVVEEILHRHFLNAIG